MTKHEKTPLQRLLAMLLCVVMVVGVFPMTANATEVSDVGAIALDTQSENEDIQLNKKVTTEDDGSFTIDLEAYALGEVEDLVKPIDLVLVLDQSASMYTPMGYHEALTNSKLFVAPEGSDIDVFDEVELERRMNEEGYKEKVKQLGYLIAQSVGGYNVYAGYDRNGHPLECSHGDVDGDGDVGGINWNNNYTKWSNADKDDCRLFRDSAGKYSGSCYWTWDWFVVKYVEDDPDNTPWHLYRVYNTTRPAVDCGIPVWNSETGKADTDHEERINKYASIAAMKDLFNFYVTQYGALYDAITAFAQGLHESNAEHRLAVAGFSCGWYASTYQCGSGIYVDGEYKLYPKNRIDPDAPHNRNKEIDENVLVGGQANFDFVYDDSLLTDEEYAQALTNVQTDFDTVVKNINAVKSDYYGTMQNVGFDIAYRILDNAPAVDSDIGEVGREKVVVLFTDGAPSATPLSDGSVMDESIKKAKDLKDMGAKVYTICTSTLAEDKVAFMQYASNDYPDAESRTATGTQIENPSYFKRVTNAENMLKEFMSIVEDVGGTTVDFDKETVLQDTIAKEFFLNEGLLAGWEAAEDKGEYLKASDKIGVYTAAYKGEDKFGEPEEFADAEIALVKNEDGTYSIQVSNFDYAANFISEEGRGKDDNFRGKKLIVTIKGVRAKDAAFTDGLVCTNGENSGLYTEMGLTVPFGRPMTKLARKTYVMDYAKPMTFSIQEWTKNMVSMSDKTIVETDRTIVATKYGKFEKVDNDKVTFTPTNMNWDEEAYFYALGDWLDIPAGVTTGENQWTKVSVIPANNIYYEDDFTTITNNGETTRVGIVYDPNSNWETEGTTQNDTVEHPENAEGETNGGVHGWEDSLTDDTGFSDGSAHWADANKQDEGVSATATFTFTGTGVDIYGRTTPSTGTVYGTLKGADESGASVSKRLIVDTLSASGDYYQIPTLSFTGLNYGTYTVTIKVTKGAESEERFIYYLDGIRVYNPMKDQSGYAPEEQNAIFTEVRDILLDAGNFGALSDGETTIEGAVFIDELVHGEENPGKESSEIGIYKDYGPKNEVYLANGQSITFKVKPEGQYYYIGLKSPEISEVSGVATNYGTALTSFGDAQSNSRDIEHSTDLYYKVIPDANGYITIKNTGAGLLSVTKIRVTGNTVQGAQILAISEDEALNAVSLFSARPVVDNSEEPVDPEIPEIPETPEVPEEPETPEIPEEPEAPEIPEEPSEPEVPDVEIQNPTEPEKPEKPEWNYNPHAQLKNLLGKLLKGLLGWFR